MAMLQVRKDFCKVKTHGLADILTVQSPHLGAPVEAELMERAVPLLTLWATRPEDPLIGDQAYLCLIHTCTFDPRAHAFPSSTPTSSIPMSACISLGSVAQIMWTEKASPFVGGNQRSRINIAFINSYCFLIFTWSYVFYIYLPCLHNWPMQ